MTTAEEVVAATVGAFDEQLHRVGFQQVGDPSGAATSWEWDGKVAPLGDPVRVSITLSDRFPFAPPRVRLPRYDAAPSWHVESDGTLCLWTTEDRGSLPWLEAGALLSKVEDWLRRDADGWRDDEPALDLEAYYEADPLGAAVVVDWNEAAN